MSAEELLWLVAVESPGSEESSEMTVWTVFGGTLLLVHRNGSKVKKKVNEAEESKLRRNMDIHFHFVRGGS
jgi:hypothetical protein